MHIVIESLVVGSIIAWLAGLVMPTEQDRRQAGIHLGEMRD